MPLLVELLDRVTATTVINRSPKAGISTENQQQSFAGFANMHLL